MRMLELVAIAGVLLGSAALPAVAQSSARFQVQDSTFNGGGSPAPVVASSSYAVTLSALGDLAPSAPSTSASFQVDGGIVGGNAPAGEASGLLVAVDRVSLDWDWAPGASAFDLYRGDAIQLRSGDYGTCLRNRIPTNTWTDASAPPKGEVYFYLVGARNRLGEPGTLGSASDGGRRSPSSPCP